MMMHKLLNGEELTVCTDGKGIICEDYTITCEDALKINAVEVHAKFACNKIVHYDLCCGDISQVQHTVGKLLDEGYTIVSELNPIKVFEKLMNVEIEAAIYTSPNKSGITAFKVFAECAGMSWTSYYDDAAIIVAAPESKIPGLLYFRKDDFVKE